MSREFIASYLTKAGEVVSSLHKQVADISSLAELLVQVIKGGGRIYSCGNGGSACDAMHLTEELVARYLRTRPGIAAQHLLDAGTLSCWSNDYDFASVFERQVQTLVRKNDALVVFTTSGRSPNVLRALKAANDIGALTVALTGKDGGEVKDLAKMAIVVSSQTTSHIQEAHAVLIHILCDLLEQKLFPNAK